MQKKWILVSAILTGIILSLSIFVSRVVNDESDINQSHEELTSLPTADSKSNLNSILLKRLKEEIKNEKQFFNRDTMAVVEENSKSEWASNQSSTNVQVQGIDEADSVKTDGTFIYQVGEREVQIIQASPASQMTLQSIITFEDTFSPFRLYIHENQLIIIGHSYEDLKWPNEKEKGLKMIAPLHEASKVIIYDVKNKQKPKKIRELGLEGGLLSSRLMDGKVYVIANKYPDLWILKDNPAIDIRPKYFDSLSQSKMEAVDYRNIQFIPNSKETNFTNIAVIDLNNSSEKMTVSTYVGSGQNMYMSKNHLFLAVTNYSTKKGGSSFQPHTTIYKFSIQADGVKFHSTGEVTGTVLNQFSMDEFNGYFRIATTKEQVWDDQGPSANYLFILDDQLKVVGELKDLARGERIYSVRFMNDRIFIVTFKETDPLFVIDGKDPKNPKVEGELKIPGFSNYLHPFDDQHLIGFGFDTKIMQSKETGNQPIILTDGVKISLFDVGDLRNPKEKFTEIIGGRGTYSLLNHDHKALLFDNRNHLFGFPITVYQNKPNSEYESVFDYQGALVYEVDLQKGFLIKANITHQHTKSVYEEWDKQITRLLYIDNTLYAISPKIVTAYDLHSFKQQAELQLK